MQGCTARIEGRPVHPCRCQLHAGRGKIGSLVVEHADPAGDLAALRAHYDILVRVADDAHATIDRLHAEQRYVKCYH
jgi:hypothetical protein